MNHKYSIQIRHHATKQWTHITTHITSDDEEAVRKLYEKDYGQPVRVVKVG